MNATAYCLYALTADIISLFRFANIISDDLVDKRNKALKDEIKRDLEYERKMVMPL